MISVYERIAEARTVLTRAGLTPNDAAIDAEVLARHALGWDRARLLADGRAPMPARFDEQFTPLIDRRAQREPVAFIIGHREFWGLDFEVTPDVLIPRPETELILDAVCEAHPSRRGPRLIFDVGTGSGCLAIALATEFPDAHIVALDISDAALRVAVRNAARNGVADRIRFVRADLLEPIRGRADVIVSNPPYVKAAVALSPEILRFEPPVALYSGAEGLTAIERLIASAADRLADEGMLAFEFGYGQHTDVTELAAKSNWGNVTINEDLQAIPRVAILRK